MHQTIKTYVEREHSILLPDTRTLYVYQVCHGVGHWELFFGKPGVKVNGQYWRDILHILRAFYGTHIQTNCLNSVSLDPLRCCFQMDEGSLEAESLHRPLPDHMATHCNCMKSATSRCPCREVNLPCYAFCKCQSEKHLPCKNPNGVINAKQMNWNSSWHSLRCDNWTRANSIAPGVLGLFSIICLAYFSRVFS